MKNKSHKKRLVFITILLVLCSLGSFIFLTLRMERAWEHSFNQGTESVEKLLSALGWEWKGHDIAGCTMYEVKTIDDKISELVTVEQIVEVSTVREHRWMLSTKKIQMKAKFRVKGGIDLKRSHIRIELMEGREENLQVTGLVPCLVSCELIPGTIEVESERGWWNPVNDIDYQETTSLLQKKANDEMKSDILSKAEESFIKKLREKLRTGDMSRDFTTKLSISTFAQELSNWS